MIENQRKLAVLIDGENVSRSTIDTIMSAVEEMGQPIVKRIYADWTNQHNINWKNVILRHAITPVQQFNYTPGKNSSDFALLLDALEIASSGKVQGFCIVTSDADFTPLVIRLRQAGMFVAGIGERKSHRSFVTACDEFVYTDEVPAAPMPTVTRASAASSRTPRVGIWNHASRRRREPDSAVYSDASTTVESAPGPAPVREKIKLPANFRPMLVQSLSTGKNTSDAPAPVRTAFRAPSAQELLEASKAVSEPAAKTAPSRQRKAESPTSAPGKSAGKTVETMDELLQVVVDIINETHDKDGWTTLTRVDSDIHKKLPGFDVKQFNYNRLITLLKNSPSLEIEMRNPGGGGMAYYIRIAQEKKEENLAVKAEDSYAGKPAEEEAKPAAKAKPRRTTKKTAAKPAAKAAGKTTAEAVEKPVVKPAEKPAANTTEKSAEKPAEKPAAKAAGKTTAEAVEKPVVKPAEKPAQSAGRKTAVKKSEPKAEEATGEAVEPAKKPAKRSHRSNAKAASKTENKLPEGTETNKQ
jgi:uncharacterized LabA/DUF88 family protein